VTGENVWQDNDGKIGPEPMHVKALGTKCKAHVKRRFDASHARMSACARDMHLAVGMHKERAAQPKDDGERPDEGKRRPEDDGR
jgi:hypothetical protein